MTDFKIENEQVIIHSIRRGDIKFPFELLESIQALGHGIESLGNALWFYNTVKYAESYEWVTAGELVGRDLTSFVLWSSRYSRSMNADWTSEDDIVTATVAESGLTAVSEDNTYINLVKFDDAKKYGDIYFKERFLLVKMTEDELAARDLTATSNALEEDYQKATLNEK